METFASGLSPPIHPESQEGLKLYDRPVADEYAISVARISRRVETVDRARR